MFHLHNIQNGSVLLMKEGCTEQTQISPIQNVYAAQQISPKLS